MAVPALSANDVARLLGRVAFGATAADLDTWTGKPYADLVDHLLDVPQGAAAAAQADVAKHAAVTATNTAAPNLVSGYLDEGGARGWWLDRMRLTPYPLLERVTLFWHGHFATAIRDETSQPSTRDLLVQNDLLRRGALGSFPTLVEQVTLDPAMLYWLDGAINRTPDPNENYARELFELFTLGKRPQVYTEKDIREAARALTGWRVEETTRLVTFDQQAHDSGTKRILGITVANLGDAEYRKVVEIALAKPVARTHVATKLVSNFAFVAKPSDKLVKTVAAKLWDVKAAVRAMLLSDEFRFASPARGRQSVRQPVEAVVHACKALGVTVDDGRYQPLLDRMGQDLFRPPNVGGWPVGMSWVTPVTVLARYELALRIYDAAQAQDLPPAADLTAWRRRLGLAGLAASTQTAVKSYLTKRKNDAEATRQQGVLALLLSSPDWVVM